MMAVRWYLRYGISYRDVDELLGERGAAEATLGAETLGAQVELIDRHGSGTAWTCCDGLSRRS